MDGRIVISFVHIVFITEYLFVVLFFIRKNGHNQNYLKCYSQASNTLVFVPEA